jgi:hypothetical protein
VPETGGTTPDTRTTAATSTRRKPMSGLREQRLQSATGTNQTGVQSSPIPFKLPQVQRSALNVHPRTRRNTTSDNTSTTHISSKHKDQAADIGEDNMVDTMTGTGVNDSGMLECEGASFLRLARGCLGRERRMNSMRSPAPKTQEKEASKAMFYRTRPRRHSS